MPKLTPQIPNTKFECIWNTQSRVSTSHQPSFPHYFWWIQTTRPPPLHSSSEFFLSVCAEIRWNVRLDILSLSSLLPHRSTMLRPQNHKSPFFVITPPSHRKIHGSSEKKYGILDRSLLKTNNKGEERLDDDVLLVVMGGSLVETHQNNWRKELIYT